MRSLAALLVLLGSLAALIGIGRERTAAKPEVGRKAAENRPRVKLAVLVVFDQMRGDYVSRWKQLFGAGGFRRLTADGAWFTNCHYPYGTTTTGPGHASILTGTCPDHHGITNNDWRERGTGVYCAANSRYSIVPPVEREAGAKPGKKVTSPAGGTPERLLCETVADVLKKAYGQRSKVFGLSLKDRSAILPTGQRPDGAFWFDGRVITSTYYTEHLDRPFPEWAEMFNVPRRADRMFRKEWTRFRPDVDYERYSGPDSGPGESEPYKMGRTFPHPITGGLKRPGKAYYDAFATSPHGSEMLLALAKQCIQFEKLGGDGVPDLLVVSFSSNDKIGHAYGPDSQEVMDITLRSDAMMADFLRFLDRSVGKGEYVLAMTADHGVCAAPESSVARGRAATRVSIPTVEQKAEKYLREQFGDEDSPAARKPAWIEKTVLPWIYLNRRVVKQSGRSVEAVSGALARYLRTLPELETAFAANELMKGVQAETEVQRRMQRSYYPGRSGDVALVLRPYDLPSGRKPGALITKEGGTTHGSPYPYDSFVPLIVFGPGISGGPRSEPVTPQATAAIFSRMLGLRLPDCAEFPVPASLESPDAALATR